MTTTERKGDHWVLADVLSKRLVNDWEHSVHVILVENIVTSDRLE